MTIYPCRGSPTHSHKRTTRVLCLTEKVSWTRPGKFDESRRCLRTHRTVSRRTPRTPSRRRGRRSTGRGGGRRRRRWRSPPSSRLQIFPHCCCWNCCWWLQPALFQNLFLENSLSCQMSERWSWWDPESLQRPTRSLETRLMLKILQNWFEHCTSVPELLGSARVPSWFSVNEVDPQ